MAMGRPRKELRDYREAFETYGGLEACVARLVARGRTNPEIAEELARVSGLKPLSAETVRVWRREWASASETVAA